MNRKFFLLIIVNMICLAQVFSDDVYIPIQKTQLKESEVITYQKKALEGDIEASALVEEYFNLEKFELIDEVKYWEEIAAENGDFMMQYKYAYSLLYDDECNPRGIFWLKQSSDSGFKDAENWLEKLKNKNIQVSYNLDDNSLKQKNINNFEKEYEEAALYGSCFAVESLCELYINNSSKFAYWNKIGAQNGSKKCQINYMKYLQSTGNQFDLLRSNFWKKCSIKK